MDSLSMSSYASRRLGVGEKVEPFSHQSVSSSDDEMQRSHHFTNCTIANAHKCYGNSLSFDVYIPRNEQLTVSKHLRHRC